MRIEVLKYFVVTAECRSMTMASNIMHVSQQCISREIKQLEEELGVQLLVRSKKGTELTKEGRIVYQRTKKILKQISELANLFEQKINMSITFGYYIGFSDAVNVILDIFDNFNKVLSINTIFYSTEKLEEDVKYGNIDIALRQIEQENLEYEISNEDYIHYILLKEPVEILMNAEKVDRGQSVFYLHTLRKYPMIFYCSSQNEKPLFERIAQRYGPLQISYKGNDKDRAWKVFRENEAVVFFTRSMYNSMKSSVEQLSKLNTKILPLDQLILVYTVLSVKKELCVNDMMKQLIDVIKDFFLSL